MGEKTEAPNCIDCEHMDFMASEAPGEVSFEFGLVLACRKKVWKPSIEMEDALDVLMLAHAANCEHYVRCED